MVHIEDALRGRAGLLCPDCGAPVLARKGNVLAHHFAHDIDRHGGDADCARAGETQLHLMAKEMIASQGTLSLPALVVSDGVSAIEAARQDETVFDVVELEVWEDGLRPDLICSKRTGAGDSVRLVVEIRVTHAVDGEKLKRLQERGDSVLEIDLSKIDRELTWDELKSVVLTDAPRTWLFHRKGKSLEEYHRGKRVERERERLRQEQEKAAKEDARKKRRASAWERSPMSLTEKEKTQVEANLAIWDLLGARSLFEVGGMEPFDRPSHAVQVEILAPYAPWRSDGGRHSQFSRWNLRDAVIHAAEHLRNKGWVKPEYSHPKDPKTAAVIERYLEDIAVGRLGVQGSLVEAREAWTSHCQQAEAVVALMKALRRNELDLRAAGGTPVREKRDVDIHMTRMVAKGKSPRHLSPYGLNEIREFLDRGREGAGFSVLEQLFDLEFEIWTASGEPLDKEGASEAVRQVGLRKLEKRRAELRAVALDVATSALDRIREGCPEELREVLQREDLSLEGLRVRAEDAAIKEAGRGNFRDPISAGRERAEKALKMTGRTELALRNAGWFANKLKDAEARNVLWGALRRSVRAAPVAFDLRFGDPEEDMEWMLGQVLRPLERLEERCARKDMSEGSFARALKSTPPGESLCLCDLVAACAIVAVRKAAADVAMRGPRASWIIPPADERG